MSKPDFEAIFKKDENFRRFSASGVLCNVLKGKVLLTFYEETIPMLVRFVSDNGMSGSEREDGSIVNYYQAVASMDVDKIPDLVDNLQRIYEQYKSGDPG